MDFKEKLMKVQTEIKAPKNLYNSFGKYKYRNAEGICEAVKPFLSKYSLFLTLEDDVIIVGDRIYIKATAVLSDTETDNSIEVSALAREAETKKGMDESQITGTASSYARKYALNGLFLLDDTKDADTDEYKQQEDDGHKKFVKELQDLCKKADRTEKYICESMKVNSFNDMNAKQMATAKAGLLKIIGGNK